VTGTISGNGTPEPDTGPESGMPTGWDARADWDEQARAVRDKPAPAGPGAAADPAPAASPAADTGPAADADRADEAATGELVPVLVTQADPDRLAQTVPLVSFTPFVAPLAPAAPVVGLDASQAGLAVASARITAATPGLAGILGQDHLRADLTPLRVPFPRLDIGLGRRQRWWLWRAVAAATVGALFAALTAWPLGLIAAGLVISADALFQCRISPAFAPAARASSARRRTRRRLARLGSAGYLSLHGRAIPGTDAVIDHLVVGPAGIYAVDSEVWDRRLPVRATRGGKLFHGPRDQAARLEHARWEANQAARLIGQALGQPIAARPAMVIYGPTVPWIVVRISGVDVFCGRRLRKYLRREAYGRGMYLDDRQVEAIHEIAAQVLPPAC